MTNLTRDMTHTNRTWPWKQLITQIIRELLEFNARIH